VSEKDRWQITQTILADRVIEICGDRVKLVFMAASRKLADLKSKDFPAVAILKAAYSGDQPDQSVAVRSTGTATIGLLIYTRSNTALLDAGEGEEILGLLRRAHPDGLIGFAPQPFADETGFPMWLQDETFDDYDGGRITQTATYAFEVWITHSE
jgi:hypothetical protein